MAQAQQITWPNHKKAVIILTYDDAINSQLYIAIPQLDAAHLTGTFFLTANINAETIPRWRAVSAKGYELANHTMYHPCLSTAYKANPANYAENYSVYTIVREVGSMNNFLYAINGKINQSYAYPCTETKVGGVSYLDSLRKSGLVKYARIGGDNNAVITDFKNLDPLLVPAWGLAANTTGDQLIAFVQKVEKAGGMGVFMFHGVGGDYITTPAASHQQLLNYLKQHPEIWVATFQQAMAYVEQAKKQN
jgi:hypothetical protein